MSFLPLLIGALAGCALRLYVLARRQRRDAQAASEAVEQIEVSISGLNQATADRLLARPDSPLRLDGATDPHEMAQFLADQTGNTILLRQIDGDGLALATPDER